MSKKIVAMLMAVAMAFSLLPVTAFAMGGTQEGNSQPVTASDKNLTMNKTVKPNGDGTYTVSLESYATGEVKNTTTTKSSDIVLLLDVSGSMNDPYATQETYSLYIGYENWQLKYYSETHWGLWYKLEDNTYVSVSVDKKDYFGSDNDKYTYSYTKDGEKVIIEESIGGYTQPEAQFYYKTDAVTKIDALKEAVNAFIDDVAEKSPTSQISIVKFAGKETNSIGNDTYNGKNYTQIVEELTKVDDGGATQLKKAVSQLTAAGATSSDYGLKKAEKALENATKDKVVVLFTDGEPNHNNGFDYKVATAAVNTAKTLKDKKTTIYTVGVFKDPSNDVHKYMSSVSSNYPDASAAVTSNGWEVTNGGSTAGTHYITAENATDLIKAFQTISSQVSSTHLDASAVVVDNVPSNFALNEGSVKVYTANCIAKNDEEFTWDEATPATPAQGISSTSTENDDGSQTISTTGFDFSKNWCGLDSKNKPTGKKLIIEFTIERTNYGGTQPTNAGAYIKAGKEANEEPIISLKDPQVPVTIELNKTLGVNDEKPYDGEGFAILTKIAAQANTLVDGINNAYVKMELTVKVDDTTTYTYKIPAKAKTGSWYQGDQQMSPEVVKNIKTSQNVRRGQNNAVDPYTYNFDLKLSDATLGGADPAEYKDKTASFKITPRDVKVKAEDKSVVAGQPAPTYTAEVTGTIGQETVNYDFSCAYNPTTSTAGTIDIVPTGEPIQGNYKVSYENGTLTVTAAPVTTGTLKVTKKVQGDDLTLNNLSDEFAITVTGDQGSAPTTLKLTDNNVEKDTSNTTATWTISDLPTGTYTVSETNAGVDGYDWTAAYDSSNETGTEKSVTVTENQTSTMTVTNKYKKQEVVPPTPADPVKLDVSCSKIAFDDLTKNSNGDWTTDVTLSLPSAEEELASDVVFVLDTSDCVGTVMDQVSGLVTQLKAAQNSSGANIKVGVVAFKGSALPMFDGKLVSVEEAEKTLTQMIGEIKAVPEKNGKPDKAAQEQVVMKYINKNDDFIYKGSNLHSGLLGAQELLKKDTDVSNTRKYVVTVTDGMTYYWNKGDDVYGVYGGSNADNTAEANLLFYTWCGVHGIDTEGTYKFPGTFSWDTYVTSAKALIAADNGAYDVNIREAAKKLGKDFSTVRFIDNADLPAQSIPYISYNDRAKHAHGIDQSVIACLATYQEMVDSKYKCYVVNSDYDTSTFPGLFTSELNKLANVTGNVDFTSIQKDILYAVSAGSIVTDTIGEKFTFGGVDSFTLKVGTEKITGVKDTSDKNTVNFGAKKDNNTYPYTVTYTPDTKTFVWTINENVSNFAPVQLTYTVKLTTPKTAAGTYGVTDLNGDGKVDGTDTTYTDTDALYTNESATMVPKDSDGHTGEKLTFPKPSVSYTVSSGNSGSHSGGSRPSLNTKDHYGYIIGYPVDYYTGQPTTDQTKKPVRPEGKITRAEVATIYFRMLTDESRTKFWSQSSGYSDVKTGDWFNNAVSTLSKAGIIAGYEDGSFRPNGYITRAEFATIAARFFDVTYNGKDLFPDISGHWAKDYINQAANKGFVNGYEDGTFKPDRNITRAEAVTLVNRTLDRHPDKNHFTKDMLVWPDNMDQTKWYYADMQEATNSHTYQMKENSDKTKYENWTKTLPIRNWEALEKAWSNANSSQGNGNVV